MTLLQAGKQRNFQGNPCLHPGDIQKLQAVNRAELLFLENVLVLPAAGAKSVAALCSGGDLDGDKFSVIWAPDLVPPDCCMHDPMDYDAVLAAAGPAVGAEPANGMFAEEDLVHFFVRVVVNDTLGRIAHMHLAFCDASEQGRGLGENSQKLVPGSGLQRLQFPCCSS